MNNKSKQLSLIMTAFLLTFYISIIMYLFFAVLHIDTFENFVIGMIFEILGFCMMAALILKNIMSKSMKTGYFVTMIIVAVLYNMFLDILNIFGISIINSTWFVLIHFVLLFLYCMVSIPMYLMGKKYNV